MTRLLLILTLIILTACNASDKTAKLKSDSVLENKFEQLTHLALADTTPITFRLDTLTNFSWDTVIILTPYLPIDKLENEIKIDLREIKNTNIESNDRINVLAFVQKGRLINYVALPRNKGDFSQIADSNKVFTNDNCTFELLRIDNKYGLGKTGINIKPAAKKLTKDN